MNKNTIGSDQLYNWSDNEPFRFPSCRADSATSGPGQATAPPRTVYSAGFVDRTLQTLRQTGLQVCPGSRARAQVLSLGSANPVHGPRWIMFRWSTLNRSPSTSTTFSKCVNCWSGFATSIASYYGAERSSEQTWSLQHLGWIWIWPGCSSPTFCKAGCKPA